VCGCCAAAGVGYYGGCAACKKGKACYKYYQQRKLEHRQRSLGKMPPDDAPSVKAQLSSEEAKHAQCVCGNNFMHDDVFCRKCGVKRTVQAGGYYDDVSTEASESYVVRPEPAGAASVKHSAHQGAKPAGFSAMPLPTAALRRLSRRRTSAGAARS